MKKWFERHFLGYGVYEHTIVVDWTDIGSKRIEKTIRKWMTEEQARRLSMVTGKLISYSNDQKSPTN